MWKKKTKTICMMCALKKICNEVSESLTYIEIISHLFNLIHFNRDTIDILLSLLFTCKHTPGCLPLFTHWNKSPYVLFQFSFAWTKIGERVGVHSEVNERWYNTKARNENPNLLSNIFINLFRFTRYSLEVGKWHLSHLRCYFLSCLTTD